MEIKLTSNAEKQAEKAEELSAFSRIKLLGIKQNLASLLELIGREQIFSEYTRHDISHIDRMLEMLDWIIPEDTKQIMTSADWLMTVLSIYFHDLGMLVTRREYDERNSSGFPMYRDNVLFAGEKGPDYRAKVKEMGEEAGEKFLYQEFVRQTHAERIRAWITGQAREKLGISKDVVEILNNLLSAFDEGFREDLAIICESHHLDDLDNFKKYKVRRPYGNNDEETANLQYSAILMRTTDLLHITKDRTPSTAFKLINPVDPISQEEWAKQMAVTTVRSQLGRDKDGNFDDQAPRDTIEVHARFSKQEGFFALTNYLLYAGEQIQKSYDKTKIANKTQGVRHHFPWRKIDDSNIETKGFLKETFGFTIDQPKILKLLTGHTLYNDTNIVLRELVQNSLDAVRLQKLIDIQSHSSGQAGKIHIKWSTRDRILIVQDNGTGMSQDVIERNLLTVGASRYSESDFIKRYPSFAPISRFGIGILSTFMIADTVEIITCSPDDENARQLSLRSVLGKYLIRLLDKEKSEEVRGITPHGTIVKLKIRYSAETPDIIKIAQQWIVVPEDEVTVVIDDSEPIKVGASSPKEALEIYLKAIGKNVVSMEDRKVNNAISVREGEKNGVTLAYALEWSEFFQEWTFLDSTVLKEAESRGNGTCVEGIRVEFDTPGFNGKKVLAIANAKGKNAPKTNVARSGLEITPERDAMLESIYSIYCDHVHSELKSLDQHGSFSLTWATKEAKYILGPLIESTNKYRATSVDALNQKILFEQIRNIPVLLVEYKGQRKATSPESLNKEEVFWTIEGPSFRSAEYLIREIPGRASLSALASLFHAQNLELPDEIVLCDANPLDKIDALAFVDREVDRLLINRSLRRIDFQWSTTSEPSRWRTFPQKFRIPEEVLILKERLGVYSPQPTTFQSIIVGHREIFTSGVEKESAVVGFGQTFIFWDSPIGKILNTHLDNLQADESRRMILAVASLFIITSLFIERRYRIPIDHFIRVIKSSEVVSYAKGILDIEELLTILTDNLTVYDPYAWSRGIA